MNRDRWYFLFFIVSCSAFYMFVIRVTLNSQLYQQNDWPIPIPYPSQALFSAWSYMGAGSPSGENIYLVATGAIASYLHNPALAERLTYFPMLFLLPITSYYFLSSFGLKRFETYGLSFLYAMSPWLIGEFMDGEPVFVAIYVMWPLVAGTVVRYREGILSLSILVPTITFSTFFTLQSISVFFVMSANFLLPLLMHKKFSSFLRITRNLMIASVVAVIANIYALQPYLHQYSSNLGSSASFDNFLYPLPFSTWFGRWESLLTIATIIFSLLMFYTVTRNTMRYSFLVAAMISGVFYFFYYFGNFPLVRTVIVDVPLLTPFLDGDKFILISWYELFLTFVFIVKSRDSTNLDFASIRNINNKKQILFKRILIKGKTILALLVLSILISSSMLTEIQSPGNHDTGKYFVPGNLNFPQSNVPVQYTELQNFLQSQNVSYGLSTHVLLMPETPGHYIPFYVGEQIIPGFSGLLQNNITLYMLYLLINSGHDLPYLLSFLGISYIAVIPNPPTSWFEADSQPSVSSWGTSYFFNGNYTYYLRDLENIPTLKLVFSEKGLWVFQNTLTVSAIYGTQSPLISEFTIKQVMLAKSLDSNYSKITFSQVGANSYKLFGTYPNESVVVDTSYFSGWVAVLSNGMEINGYRSPYSGFVEFTPPKEEKIIEVKYAPQPIYDFLLVISFGGIGVAFTCPLIYYLNRRKGTII